MREEDINSSKIAIEDFLNKFLMEISDQLRKGTCFDDMYQHRRVSKQNVYHMPKE